MSNRAGCATVSAPNYDSAGLWAIPLPLLPLRVQRTIIIAKGAGGYINGLCQRPCFYYFHHFHVTLRSPHNTSGSSEHERCNPYTRASSRPRLALFAALRFGQRDLRFCATAAAATPARAPASMWRVECFTRCRHQSGPAPWIARHPVALGDAYGAL